MPGPKFHFSGFAPIQLLWWRHIDNIDSNRLLAVLAAAQTFLGVRVLARMARGAGERPIVAGDDDGRPVGDERVSVVVPALDERDRLGPCLDGLVAQGAEVGEIVVVDGGSRDGTQGLVRAYAARDPRVRLIDASPVPDGWNGKAWGLQVGLERGGPSTEWVLTIDADVRPAPGLARALLARAREAGVPALSVATAQEVVGLGEGLLHPALLATVVYRFGPPGRAVRRVGDVQANGQCFLARRDALVACDAFAVARASRCEDITVARCLVATGHAVGFYEAEGLVAVRMYEGWRETWRNWPRSLPMRDRYTRWGSLVRLSEVVLVQAAPLPLGILLVRRLLVRRLPRPAPRSAPRAMDGWVLCPLVVNGVLALARLGVLAGMARAYRRRPWTYWLSPLCDAPVALRLVASAVQRRHTWRGRNLIDGGTL